MPLGLGLACEVEMLRELTIRHGWLSKIQYWCFQFPLHRLFQCPFGRHEYLVIHVTNGETSVMGCFFCGKGREATPEEIAAHPNLRYTEEELARRDAKIEESMKWLRANGYLDDED
jgi:hypothetical protein